jgi:hypothetical protein
MCQFETRGTPAGAGIAAPVAITVTNATHTSIVSTEPMSTARRIDRITFLPSLRKRKIAFDFVRTLLKRSLCEILSVIFRSSCETPR